MRAVGNQTGVCTKLVFPSVGGAFRRTLSRTFGGKTSKISFFSKPSRRCLRGFGTCLSGENFRITGWWGRCVGVIDVFISLFITLGMYTTKRGRLPTGKSLGLAMFSGRGVRFMPSACTKCSTTNTSKIVRLIGNHVVLGGVRVPSCRQSIAIDLGIAMTSGNSH